MLLADLRPCSHCYEPIQTLKSVQDSLHVPVSIKAPIYCGEQKKGEHYHYYSNLGSQNGDCSISCLLRGELVMASTPCPSLLRLKWQLGVSRSRNRVSWIDREEGKSQKVLFPPFCKYLIGWSANCFLGHQESRDESEALSYHNSTLVSQVKVFLCTRNIWHQLNTGDLSFKIFPSRRNFHLVEQNNKLNSQLVALIHAQFNEVTKK